MIIGKMLIAPALLCCSGPNGVNGLDRTQFAFVIQTESKGGFRSYLYIFYI